MAERKTYELVVQQRELTGKHNKKLRRQHILPAVVYGHRVASQPIQVDQKEFERVYLRAGSNSLVDLKVGEKDQARKVFVHSVQRDPISHAIEHVDFLVVNLLEEITTTVPLALVGESPAVRIGEGMLLSQLDHLQIRALPADIPSVVEVDISGLDELDKAIHVSDLEIPENVHVLNNENDMVVKVTALPLAEVAVEEAEEAEAAEAAAEAGEAPEAEAES